MSAFYRSLIAWTLAVGFATLVAVGEGWHFIPGNSHWVELPNGRGLVVGVAAQPDVGRAPNAGQALTARRPDDLPLKDANSCLICRVSGQAKLRRMAFDGPSLKPFAQRLAEPACRVSEIRISSPFHARAPPRV